MKPLTRSNWLAAAGLLLALPTAWVIFISVLKYGLGIDGPFDSSQPTLERWGISESLGWNINLLILLGPIAGFLLAIFQVLKLRWQFTADRFELNLAITRRWFPILVAAFSISIMAILVFYMLGENCNCPGR